MWPTKIDGLEVQSEYAWYLCSVCDNVDRGKHCEVCDTWDTTTNVTIPEKKRRRHKLRTFWTSVEDEIHIRKEMRKMGFTSFSDYVRAHISLPVRSRQTLGERQKQRVRDYVRERDGLAKGERPEGLPPLKAYGVHDIPEEEDPW